MSYKIVTDSCCDFTQQMYDQLGADMVPLSVTFQGNTYNDRNDDSLKQMYAQMRQGESATTSAVNPMRWEMAFREILKQGQDILAIAFSSGLSTTYQSAVIAANELRDAYPSRRIYVVDSLAASMGQGLLVWYACRMQQEGQSIEAVRDWLEENKLHLCHWFTVDDLLFLQRGGRVSTATAILGTMLSVKPVLKVNDEGKLISVSKARGRKAALAALVKQFGEQAQGYNNDTIMISHGDCLEDAQTVAEALKQKYGVRNVIINYIGTVIGSHAGPGTVALFFLGRQR